MKTFHFIICLSTFDLSITNALSNTLQDSKLDLAASELVDATVRTLSIDQMLNGRSQCYWLITVM